MNLVLSKTLPVKKVQGLYRRWFEEWYGITLAPENLFERVGRLDVCSQLRTGETLADKTNDGGIQTDREFSPLPQILIVGLICRWKSTVPLSVMAFKRQEIRCQNAVAGL